MRGALFVWPEEEFFFFFFKRGSGSYWQRIMSVSVTISVEYSVKICHFCRCVDVLWASDM